MTRHPHADIIHAWAEGVQVQCKNRNKDEWEDCHTPSFWTNVEYRIKPTPEPWYENIPEHGVLCWVSDVDEHIGSNTNVRIIKQYNSNFECPFRVQYSGWRYAKPLTNDEIRKFLRPEEEQ